MAAKKFTTVVKEYTDYVTQYAGISRDNYLSESSPDSNYGGSSDLILEFVDDGGDNKELRPIFEVIMPTKSDFGGEIEIIKVEVMFYARSIVIPVGCNSLHFTTALIDVADVWDEQVAGGFGITSTWNHARELIPWINKWDGGGAAKSHNSNDEEYAAGETISAIYGGTFYESNPATNFWISFELKNLKLEDKKSFVWVFRDTDAYQGTNDSMKILMWSRHWIAGPKPKLVITYKDFAPEGFDDKENGLKIAPDTSNPERPKLSWSPSSTEDVTGYKIYYKTTPFDLPSQATLLTTIADKYQSEYIDVQTLSTNQLHYYRIICEDSVNIGDGALISNMVSFTRPNITDIEGDRSISAGSETSVTVSTLIDCVANSIDWGDGSGETWYEKVEAYKTITKTHTYTKVGVWTIKARYESKDGYWSGLENVCVVTVTDRVPICKLIARPTVVDINESIVLNGSLSYPIGSNSTLTNYKFERRSSGGWSTVYNGVNPIYTHTEVAAYSDVEFRLTVTNNSGLLSVDSVGLHQFVKVVDPVATELVFSTGTVISKRDESRESDVSTSLVHGSSDGEVSVMTGLRDIKLTFDGVSRKENMYADLELIKSSVINYSFVKIIVRDIPGHTITYSGRITDYSISKNTTRYALWSFRMHVESVT